SSGSPPGSSSTKINCPFSRTRAKGTTAQAGSSLVLSEYSCSSRPSADCSGSFDDGTRTKIWRRTATLRTRENTKDAASRTDSIPYVESSINTVSLALPSLTAHGSKHNIGVPPRLYHLGKFFAIHRELPSRYHSALPKECLLASLAAHAVM